MFPFTANTNPIVAYGNPAFLIALLADRCDYFEDVLRHLFSPMNGGGVAPEFPQGPPGTSARPRESS